jgi:hypothetical protein
MGWLGDKPSEACACVLADKLLVNLRNSNQTNKAELRLCEVPLHILVSFTVRGQISKIYELFSNARAVCGNLLKISEKPLFSDYFLIQAN